MNAVCSLCDLELERKPTFQNHRYYVSCPRCGEYSIFMDAQDDIPDDKSFPRYLLAGYAREMSEMGSPADITNKNKEEIIRSYLIPKTVPEKVDKLIQYIGKKSDYPGLSVSIKVDLDRSIAYAQNADEMNYLLRYLGNAGLIEKNALTVKGWERFHELQQSNPDTRNCFVAMWFDKSMNSVYLEGFEKAIREAGYEPVRIDRIEHVNKIDDQIIAEIRRSRFLVADFTGHRGGVYFEAGFAMGLGLPVIWTCRDTDIDDTHFDTRQYNHIVWSNAEDLREKLLYRIRAIID